MFRFLRRARLLSPYGLIQKRDVEYDCPVSKLMQLLLGQFSRNRAQRVRFATTDHEVSVTDQDGREYLAVPAKMFPDLLCWFLLGRYNDPDFAYDVVMEPGCIAALRARALGSTGNLCPGR